jgi:putative oxidoreductase
MSKLFSTRLNNSTVQLSLFMLRLAAGGFMLTHGFPKLERLINGNFRFSDPIGLGPEVSLVLVVFAEFFCAILVIIGLGTRLATLPLIIAMSVAAFVANANAAFAKKELALIYLVSFVILLLTGPGKISFDYFVGKGK